MLVAVAEASEEFLLVFRFSGSFLREGLSSSVVSVDLSELYGRKWSPDSSRTGSGSHTRFLFCGSEQQLRSSSFTDLKTVMTLSCVFL